MLITPRRKKTILTILLLLFVYASSVGQTAGSGITAENSSTYIMLGFLQFLITTVIMMIVPFIWRLINGEKFSANKGKRICKWNSIILFLASIASTLLLGIGLIGGLGAIIYYFINKWTFVDEEDIEGIRQDTVQGA